jgi:hypothetical protein
MTLKFLQAIITLGLKQKHKQFMKAIFINARDKRVEQIDINPGLEELYKTLDVRVITVAYSQDPAVTDDLIVDDEALLKDVSDLPGGFWADFYPSQPLLGNALMLGVDPETGESKDCTVTLEEITKRVRFLTDDELKYFYNLLKDIPAVVIPLP